MDKDEPEPLSHNDYTVGWVCALSKEQTAAKAMLDQIHPPLPKPPNDSNSYILGSIGGHNIVITCLPDGLMGTCQAAAVATRMVSTFQSIKVGLMVGIGGGVPPNVKLGDIVVSRPTGQYGGVVQWDFGKALQNGEFKRMGTLNKPPKVLLTALSALRSEHEMNGPQIERCLKDIERRYPKMAPRYTRRGGVEAKAHTSNVSSGPNTFRADQLLKTIWKAFLALLAYVFGSWALGSIEYNDEKQIIHTTDLAKVEKKSDSIGIHYGLIASGNQVIKDAKVRDKINESLGGEVLCVEMEAAGLMDDFPCIVIRGICDYADSRKNDEWQEYAAAVAAAYAKEYLWCLQPIEVHRERSIKDTISQVQQNVQKIMSRLDREEDLKVLEWITPIRSSERHNDVVQKRQPGTGQWLLKSIEYQNWIKDGQMLFCPGVPGAGKTFLTSVVIDHLFTWFSGAAGESSEVGIAYIYFNFKREQEQTLTNVLASILKQLAQRQPSLPKVLQELYNKHKHAQTRMSTDGIISALRSVLETYSKTFIVIDALDECVSEYCRPNLLKVLFDLSNDCGVNIFATSRHIQEVTEHFNRQGSLTLEISARDEDLQNYIDGQIELSGRDVLINNREAIKSEIGKAVGGMFLLARLYYQSIKSKKSVKELKKALAAIATREKRGEVYHLVYEEAMGRIKEQESDYRDLAYRVISWLVCAKRPLSKLEIQQALAVEPESNTRELDEENLTEVNEMLSVCAGLVTIDEHSNIVRLIHYTTQEYFDKTWANWFPNAQNDITRVCTAYLLYDRFEVNAQTKEAFVERVMSNALFEYAALNWGWHAKESSTEATQDLLMDLLRSDTRMQAISQVLFEKTIVAFRRPQLGEGFTKSSEMQGIHFAAYFGLRNLLQQLLDEGVDVDAGMKSGYRTPILWAIEQGHQDVVELLLHEGANEKSITSIGQTPLLLAAENGRLNIIEFFLKRGVDLGDRDSFGKTAIGFAAQKGQATVVEFLASNGANLEAKDKIGRTALLEAAYYGHLAVVEVLASKGANLESTDNEGRTPVLWAAYQRQTEVVEFLANKKVNLNCGGRFYGTYYTALDLALTSKSARMVEALVRGGVDPHAEDEDGTTPLFAAVGEGDIRTVKFLVGIGANVNHKDKDGDTALGSAAHSGYIETVQYLVEMGADFEVRGGYYNQTPLSKAAEEGRLEVVQFLVSKGADIEIKDTRLGQTPLSLAAEMGHSAVVDCLLRAGADQQAKDKKHGRTPLEWAIDDGDEETIKLLGG